MNMQKMPLAAKALAAGHDPGMGGAMTAGADLSQPSNRHQRLAMSAGCRRRGGVIALTAWR